MEEGQGGGQRSGTKGRVLRGNSYYRGGAKCRLPFSRDYECSVC